MKEYFNFLGFKINTKKFMLSLGVFAFVVLLLVIVDMLFLEVSWYGFLTGLAFLLAVVISNELMPERNLKKDFSYDLIWWIFPFSIIGARIAFVVNNIELFDSFWEMCAIWNGGQSIYGGVIGGIVGLIICSLIHKQNPVSAMDCVAPVLILGQAIGRWGNFINQELYGWEIKNKAFQWFPIGVEVNGTWHLALFFYESVLNLLGFFLLLFILRKTKKKGVVTLTWFAYYGLIRFFLEPLRLTKYIMYIPNTTIQWSSVTSILMFAVGVIGLVAIFIKDYIDKKKGLVSDSAKKIDKSESSKLKTKQTCKVEDENSEKSKKQTSVNDKPEK